MPWPNRGLDCETREGGPAGSSHDPFSKVQVADVQGTRRTRLLNVLSGVDEDRERADRPLHAILQTVLSRRGIIGEAGADTASAIAGKRNAFLKARRGGDPQEEHRSYGGQRSGMMARTGCWIRINVARALLLAVFLAMVVPMLPSAVVHEHHQQPVTATASQAVTAQSGVAVPMGHRSHGRRAAGIQADMAMGVDNVISGGGGGGSSSSSSKLDLDRRRRRATVDPSLGLRDSNREDGETVVENYLHVESRERGEGGAVRRIVEMDPSQIEDEAEAGSGSGSFQCFGWEPSDSNNADGQEGNGNDEDDDNNDSDPCTGLVRGGEWQGGCEDVYFGGLPGCCFIPNGGVGGQCMSCRRAHVGRECGQSAVECADVLLEVNGTRLLGDEMNTRVESCLGSSQDGFYWRQHGMVLVGEWTQLGVVGSISDPSMCIPHCRYTRECFAFEYDAVVKICILLKGYLTGLCKPPGCGEESGRVTFARDPDLLYCGGEASVECARMRVYHGCMSSNGCASTSEGLSHFSSMCSASGCSRVQCGLDPQSFDSTHHEAQCADDFIRSDYYRK